MQEILSQLEELQSASPPLDPTELVERERRWKQLTDRLQSLSLALQLQRALASEEMRKKELDLAQAGSKKLKNFGWRPVTIRFLGGAEISLVARYFARSEARVTKGKGAYCGLILLGVHDRAKLAAAMNSLEDARGHLKEMGVKLSVKQIATIAYHFSRRARQV